MLDEFDQNDERQNENPYYDIGSLFFDVIFAVIDIRLIWHLWDGFPKNYQKNANENRETREKQVIPLVVHEADIVDRAKAGFDAYIHGKRQDGEENANYGDDCPRRFHWIIPLWQGIASFCRMVGKPLLHMGDGFFP